VTQIMKTTQIPKTQNLFLSISLSFLTNPATKQLKSYNSQEEEGKVTGIATADRP
jgi:flagellar biosynthesis protein FliR